MIEYEGRVSDSRKAMRALGILDRAGEKPRCFHTVTLFNRTEEPYRPIGKIFLIGGPPIDDTDKTIMQSVAMQLDTKLMHHYETKRNLRRSLSEDQVEFFIQHPVIAKWFFETARNVEIAMVYTDIVGYTHITRRINDPSETIRVAKERILKEIELTARHGGYFDKDIGDCAVSLFGPPFYELSIDSLLEAKDTADLERLMEESPPNRERYAFQAVMYALESVEAIRNVEMGSSRLEISVGIEVKNVAIGDLNGNMGSLTAMGDGMNLAARLQGVANAGQIVIGPGCREKLEGYRKNNLAKSLPFQIEEGGVAELKGYDKPVEYFLVSSNGA